MINIAMIEDDTLLADLLKEYLKKSDISVINFEDPFIALSEIRVNRKKYDLIILDLTLPGLDGLEVCKSLIDVNIPIIISSARSSIDDKIKTLGIGADDYITKPYEPKELELRIFTILRRNKRYTKPKEKNDKLILKDKSIYLDGKLLDLTLAEFQVLSYLIERKNSIVDRYDIINDCDFFKSRSCNDSLNVIISRIRKKIGKEYISNIKGIGYKLNVN